MSLKEKRARGRDSERSLETRDSRKIGEVREGKENKRKGKERREEAFRFMWLSLITTIAYWFIEIMVVSIY